MTLYKIVVSLFMSDAIFTVQSLIFIMTVLAWKINVDLEKEMWTAGYKYSWGKMELAA